MGLIKHHPPAAVTTADRLAAADKLRQLFAIRLQSERVHFVTLSAALARAEDAPGAIFDDLGFRAHRLRGAAATFEFAPLAAAAGALERASFAAAEGHAPHTDAGVWAALVALVHMLGILEQDARHEPDAVAVALGD